MVEDCVLYNGKSYEICVVPNNQMDIMNSGFYFADRRLILEIGLQDFQATLKCRQGIEFEVRNPSKETLEDIYKIAEKSFECDRRFALDYQMEDVNLKNKCLRMYMEKLMNDISNPCKTLVCVYGECIIGFLVYKEDKMGAEIMLASMAENYKKMGIGYFMYSYLFYTLKENGIKKVRSKVFSSNVESVNLHIRLGKSIKVKGYEDWYIREVQNV